MTLMNTRQDVSQNSKPVIFHLLTAFGVGGAERLIERLMPGATDFQHIIISLRGDGPMRQDFERAGMQTKMLHMGFLFSPRAFFSFWKLVRQYRPQVLDTCLVHADLIGRIWGKLCGVPKNTCYLVARYRDRRYWLVAKLMLWTDWLVDGYIAVSAEVQRYFVEDVGLSERKFTIIVNSVDPNAFQPPSSNELRKHILRQLEIPAEARIVGSISNLRQEKCIDRLIASLPETLRHVPNAYCIIAGRGVYKTALEEQAQRLGVADRVRFVGYWPDLHEMHAAMDVYVLPSMFEGMSIALLEAMSSARAIVVTDTPENREVIATGTGLLVDTTQPAALSQAITKLLQQPELCHSLGQAARARVEHHFNLRQSIMQASTFFHQFV